MKILKVGGTSVGSTDGLLKIREIISNTEESKIVVCSAMSGVTDILLNLTKYIKVYDEISVVSGLNVLKNRHYVVIEELFSDELVKRKVKDFVIESLDRILILLKSEYSEETEYEIITYGERLLTKIYATYLSSIGIVNILLDARDFMVIDEVEAPDITIISTKLKSLLSRYSNIKLFITQGFIRMTNDGKLRHLSRGGSDYSATLIGAAVSAKEVQIWSDVDGFHNCDPKVVENTLPIPYLSYDEAAELAYFGAKILHPQTVYPVKKFNIPLILKNTFQVDAQGTMISNEVLYSGRKAIAIKDNLMKLKITFYSEFDSDEITKKILSEFKKNCIAIDFFFKSKKYIEVTVEQQMIVYEILDALEDLGKIDFKKELSIVCIAGYDFHYKEDPKLIKIINKLSVNEVFSCVNDLMSTKILIESKNGKEILEKLHKQLFVQENNCLI